MPVASDEMRAIAAKEKTESVLRTEAEQIHGDHARDLGVSRKQGEDLYRSLNRLNSAALCLSGGGIRSAAFCLGVIQALATHPRGAPPSKGEPGQPCGEAEKCLL